MKLKALLLAPILALTGCYYSTGTGTKVGTVIQVSDDGTLHKTHEMEIVRGGMAGGTGGFSTTPFYATVADPGLQAKIKDAFDKQYEVKITYTEYLLAPWSSDNKDNAFVNDVQPAK